MVLFKKLQLNYIFKSTNKPHPSDPLLPLHPSCSPPFFSRKCQIYSSLHSDACRLVPGRDAPSSQRTVFEPWELIHPYSLSSPGLVVWPSGATGHGKKAGSVRALRRRLRINSASWSALRGFASVRFNFDPTPTGWPQGGTLLSVADLV